jgi:hypothetical protein
MGLTMCMHFKVNAKFAAFGVPDYRRYQGPRRCQIRHQQAAKSHHENTGAEDADAPRPEIPAGDVPPAINSLAARRPSAAEAETE